MRAEILAVYERLVIHCSPKYIWIYMDKISVIRNTRAKGGGRETRIKIYSMFL